MVLGIAICAISIRKLHKGEVSIPGAMVGLAIAIGAPAIVFGIAVLLLVSMFALLSEAKPRKNKR